MQKQYQLSKDIECLRYMLYESLEMEDKDICLSISKELDRLIVEYHNNQATEQATPSDT